MKRHLLSLFLLLTILSACSQSTSTENKTTTQDSVYRYEPVGWEMNLPDGYEFMSEQEGKRLEEKGLDAIRETAEEDLDPEPVNNLLNFRKGQNVFLSTSQDVDLEDISYEDVHNDLIDLMIQTYKDNNLGVNHSQNRETIGGREFIRDEFKLTTSDGRHLLSQVMYSKLFGSHELSVTITWTNEACGNEMLNCWRKSKFN